MNQRKLQKATVVSNGPMGSFHHLVLNLPEPARCHPGQFAMLQGPWSGVPLWPRAFSFFDAWASSVSFLYKIVGPGTQRLGSVRPGEVLQCNGPLGRGFGLPERDETPVLISGGSGVAPIHCLAMTLIRDHQRTPLVFCGGKTQKDLSCLAPLFDRCETVVTTDDGSSGIKGVITEPFEARVSSFSNPKIYACGPVPMLRKLHSVVVQHRLRCEMAFETTMACGMGFCMGCALPAMQNDYLYLCQDGPVLDPSLLDWSRFA